MMFGIPAEHVVPIANLIGLGILGLLAFFGQRWGKARPTPAEKNIVEVAGALVDSTAVQHLAAAIEASTVESMEARAQIKAGIEAIFKLARVLDHGTGEVEELRRAIGDLANQIARHG